MAVGTVGCGVVELCGSNAFPVLESTILIGCVVLFVVACKNRIVKFIEHFVSGGIAQTTSVQAGAVLMPLAMFLLSLKSIRVL